jgi:hypothetical protein
VKSTVTQTSLALSMPEIFKLENLWKLNKHSSDVKEEGKEETVEARPKIDLNPTKATYVSAEEYADTYMSMI